MTRVRWSGPAGRDLEAALDFIAIDDMDAADRLATSVYKSVSRLERFPLSGRLVPELNDPNVREVLHSPFRIVYQPTPKHIEILAVIRSEQEPDFESIVNRAPREA